jgi:hypothetical protein
MAKKTTLDLICSPFEAAAILGLTEERVLQLCRTGVLSARKMGRDWVILTDSVGKYGSTPRKRGPKPKSSKG